MAEEQQAEQQASEVPQGAESTTDWKAEARKWEERAKKSFEKAKAYDELKARDATETERLQRQLDEATAKVAEFEGEHERARWAKEISESTGVPASWLRGSTKEEMEAHAAEISKDYKRQTAPVVSGDGQQPEPPKGSGDWLRDAFTKAR